MYNFKKFVALGMAAVMTLGCGVTAFATAGDEDAAVEVTGAGTSAFVDKDVYAVAVPTGDALTKTLAFTTDPYGLVAEAHPDKKIEDGAKVLFASTLDGLDYAGTSDALTITNKSSMGIVLDIEAKLVKGSATYAAGYSKTKDFSGTGDDATGLYFGLLADNEVEKPLDETGVTFKNVALSAADEYEVKDNDGTYTYTIKTDATDLPKYEFAVTAALNTDAAETTWYSISNKVKTALTMPSLSVKFTPTGIRECKEASVLVEGENFYISKPDVEGGFGTTKPTAILVNGKAVTTVSDNEDGYVKVTWKDVYTAWGYTDTTIKDLSEDEQNIIFNGVKNFKVTANSVDYYAEVK
ncbi:hypothetical protein bpr_I2200 [Butyrivibrio proteoclasticus B316]|uniref:Uncharacterized protein n=1 Tax=Butyrivibrio proteoclasticus (strain ATCC 51982 / DSM 14932 / B316) TaxID=515622 RepID=E0RX25_BUTPB|nr:hypothetical protein [Butyrivibrio proteoclasticus]ADL34933.1 hypothetical protein bpr_I2200 [Butyrivibrio proteoclasticus B316]